MALNMDIATNSKFDRKTISIQIIQKHIKFLSLINLLEKMAILILKLMEKQNVSVLRLHMEEDAGKSTHKDGYSLVDLNRQGTPLIEMYLNPIFVHLKKHMLI